MQKYKNPLFEPISSTSLNGISAFNLTSTAEQITDPCHGIFVILILNAIYWFVLASRLHKFFDRGSTAVSSGSNRVVRLPVGYSLVMVAIFI